jgi:hypothetical protein
VARDLVDHFEQRLEAMDGKRMVACMSRRICADLYGQIVKLRPAWHDADDERGAIKVVMTGSASDPLVWQPHIRPKAGRARLADRLKAADDPLRLVIVRDMWLTGFDAPPLPSPTRSSAASSSSSPARPTTRTSTQTTSTAATPPPPNVSSSTAPNGSATRSPSRRSLDRTWRAIFRTASDSGVMPS